MMKYEPTWTVPPMWSSQPSNMFATFHQHTAPDEIVVVDLLAIDCIEQQGDHCLILLRSGHYAEVDESIEQVMRVISERGGP